MPRHSQPCTDVSAACPVGATLYGYYPNLGGNAFLCAIFFLCALVQLVLGIKGRMTAFTIAVTTGCAAEGLGYIGRLMMHSNPWSQSAFDIQICCLVLAPSFLAAGLYLSLKHLVLHFGSSHSRLPPKYYPWIFISCDIVSILMQAAGGGTAASETATLVVVGDKMIVAGIAFQVATMSVCGLLAVDFAARVWRARRREGRGVLETESRGFELYLWCITIAFVTIYIRCIYRLPEMAGGWGNPLMRREPEFMVLDGMMIVIACILLSVAHPAIFFPALAGKKARKTAAEEEDVESKRGFGLTDVEAGKMSTEKEGELNGSGMFGEHRHGLGHASSSSDEEGRGVGS